MISYSDYGSGIYQIKNNINGKVYVGSATNFSKRWGTHIGLLRKGTHHSRHLQRAYNKYGEDSFSFSVIEYVTDLSKLVEREQYWLDYYKPFKNQGYNTAPFAASNIGVFPSKEARRKMAKAQTGRRHSPETLEKIRRSKYREALSKETLAKYSLCNKGESNPLSKLTTSKVIEIKKRLLAKDSHSKIAKLMDVSRGQIGSIARGEAWAHVLVDGFTPSSIDTKKLDTNSVIDIKRMLMKGVPQKEICSRYGVGTSIVSDINNGRHWKDVYVEGFHTVKSKSTKKLNALKVRRIRQLLSKGMRQEEIAKRYGISNQTVSGINRGWIWKEVDK